MKTVRVYYFAQLREARGLSEEDVCTAATTPGELYEQLRQRWSLPLSLTHLRAAANEEFCSMNYPLQDGDAIAFIPPAAGG